MITPQRIPLPPATRMVARSLRPCHGVAEGEDGESQRAQRREW